MQEDPPRHCRVRRQSVTDRHHKMVSLMCTLEHHRDEVNSCDFSPTLLATCSGDKTIRLYDATHDDGSFPELPFSPLSGHGYGVHCCRFSSCGGHLVTCSTDASIMTWSPATGEPPGCWTVWWCLVEKSSNSWVSFVVLVGHV